MRHSVPVAFYLCDLGPFLFQAPMKKSLHNISEGGYCGNLNSCFLGCVADMVVTYYETIFEDCGAFTNLLVLHREGEKL